MATLSIICRVMNLFRVTVRALPVCLAELLCINADTCISFTDAFLNLYCTIDLVHMCLEWGH
uniref:Uncharacterized protein n=1 Tax=Setaria viridis TaxID=4556 RepID=A0A4U6TXM1_SETVI|nr:hypothetical protein SEVIR_7G243666v2 [Setaria viridis]